MTRKTPANDRDETTRTRIIKCAICDQIHPAGRACNVGGDDLEEDSGR